MKRCLWQAVLQGAADGYSSDEEESDGDTEGSEEEEALAEAQAQAATQGVTRPAIYNTEAMHSILEDIGWPEGAQWEESLAVTGDDGEQV